VSKGPASATFGNDTAMFIRVRRRALKGGHRDWRAYRKSKGLIAEASASYDVVRAVRINGKPRQKFLLGLGSLKVKERDEARDLIWFWVHAMCRMRRHGLSDEQQRRLIAALVRKGVQKPSTDECLRFAKEWSGGVIGAAARQLSDLVIAGESAP
jgi:hypothetical protein